MRLCPEIASAFHAAYYQRGLAAFLPRICGLAFQRANRGLLLLCFEKRHARCGKSEFSAYCQEQACDQGHGCLKPVCAQLDADEMQQTGCREPAAGKDKDMVHKHLQAF
ncbi:MAG TPA: hypothetical protein VFF88_04565 [Methylocella sp.]|nr:hypothetical protein [Methylocella sp.]